MGMKIYALIGILLLCLLALRMVPLSVFPSMHMLDIGQGDSLLFQEKNTQVLIDGGSGSIVLTRLAEEMPWFDRRIEVVVATHYDKDHLEGLLHVLSTYDVGMVIMPQYAATTTNIKKEFIDLLIQRHIPYRFGRYGQILHADSLVLRVMSPIPGDEWTRLSKSKSNNASIIMRADIMPQGKRPMSFLLTGDAESGIEKQLVSSIPASAFDVDVLKVGHHGSKTSTSSEFLAAASPFASLISVGANNTYGHPTTEVLERLKNTQIFRTDQKGTISFFFDGNSWMISCERKTDLPFSQKFCMHK